jgi:hypothetical protein
MMNPDLLNEYIDIIVVSIDVNMGPIIPQYIHAYHPYQHGLAYLTIPPLIENIATPIHENIHAVGVGGLAGFIANLRDGFERVCRVGGIAIRRAILFVYRHRLFLLVV